MRIGLVAHDTKKSLMQNLCIAYHNILSKHDLYATGTTGRLIEEATNLRVFKYLSGALGGVQQMGLQIEQNQMDMLIFLQDPLQPAAHEPLLENILKQCDAHNIPCATNLATAEVLILALDQGYLNWRNYV